jgi:hypothetical protein
MALSSLRMATSALLSATFHEPGYRHLVELVHQQDLEASRRLSALEVAVSDAAGGRRGGASVDTGRGVVDLDELLGGSLTEAGRVLVVFDARYEPSRFPYRPHHYAYLQRTGSPRPPLYYAVNATLGGVPDRVGTTRLNHFETYLFLQRGPAHRSTLLLGNLSRFAAARADVTTFYGPERLEQVVELAPKAHAEVALAAEHSGHRLGRVELKAPFRLTSYVAGREAASGDLVLFDHLFTYFK